VFCTCLHAGYTHQLVPQMSVWAQGARLSFEIYMWGDTQIYRTTPVHTHTHEKCLRPGYHTALRSLLSCPQSSVGHRATAIGNRELRYCVHVVITSFSMLWMKHRKIEQFLLTLITLLTIIQKPWFLILDFQSNRRVAWITKYNFWFDSYIPNFRLFPLFFNPCSVITFNPIWISCWKDKRLLELTAQQARFPVPPLTLHPTFSSFLPIVMLLPGILFPAISSLPWSQLPWLLAQCFPSTETHWFFDSIFSIRCP
jgi:hypothetical protein